MKLKSTKKRKLTFTTDDAVNEGDSCLEMPTTMRRRVIHQQCESQLHPYNQCFLNPLMPSDSGSDAAMRLPQVTVTTGTVSAHHPLPSSSSTNCQQQRQWKKHCSSAHLHPPHHQPHQSTLNLPSPLSSRHNIHQNVTSEKRNVRTFSVHSPNQRRPPSGAARHRRPMQSLLMVTLLLSVQMVTVHAMLDALKALFILTGASTYLGESLLLLLLS